MTLKRRDLVLAAAGSLATAAVPVTAATSAGKHRIGHTGITWGYSPQAARQAIADVGRLGYHGFESFGSVLEYWDSKGGLHDDLAAAGLPLVGAYCPMILTDAARRADEVAKLVRWGRLIAGYGGTVAVIGPDNVDRTVFDFDAGRATIVESLNAMGRALEEIGVIAALHQHTGSCITTRQETDRVMRAVDTDAVKLCPDTGELLAAGVDPVAFVRDYLPLIAHVHIKDYNGGAMHDGYTTVGAGEVDVAGVCEILETADTGFMIMAELNPDTPSNLADPDTPYARAAGSKGTFEALGYHF